MNGKISQGEEPSKMATVNSPYDYGLNVQINDDGTIQKKAPYQPFTQQQQHWTTTTASSTATPLTESNLNGYLGSLWNSGQGLIGTSTQAYPQFPPVQYQWQNAYNSVTIKEPELMPDWRENLHKWTYDPNSRLWNDGSGNIYEKLPVGITMEDIMKAHQKAKPRAYKEGECVQFIGQFSVTAYADWFRSRLQHIYSLAA